MQIAFNMSRAKMLMVDIDFIPTPSFTNTDHEWSDCILHKIKHYLLATLFN